MTERVNLKRRVWTTIYILKNGIKHKRAKSFMDPYNSWVVLHDFRILGIKSKKLISAYIPRDFKREYEEYRQSLDRLILFEKELRFVVRRVQSSSIRSF